MERVSSGLSATIANGGSLSSAVRADYAINGSLLINTDFTSPAAITFQGSHNGSDYYNIYDDAGAEVAIPSHATHTGRAYELPAACMNFRFLKVRSGTAASPVTQSPGAAGTTVTVALKS